MIDGCPHTFVHLAFVSLPACMARLRDAIPREMTMFVTSGQGPTAILRKMDKNRDFAGCYVPWDGAEPFYTGISRAVVTRLMQHVRGRTHFSASLAYRIACAENKHNLRRHKAMADVAFNLAFETAKQRIVRMTVSFVEIENATERYLFEVYASMLLNTQQFNTFETH